MAWETRRNGRRYYYHSYRLNGEVVKEYFGNGVAAQMFAKLDEADAREARLNRQLRDRRCEEWPQLKR